MTMARRTKNGGKITVKAVRPECSSKGDYDLQKLPGVVDPVGLTNQQLLQHLCSAGPINCAKCKLCSYGRQWLKREEERLMGRKIESKGSIFEAYIRLRNSETFVLQGTIGEMLERLGEMRESLESVKLKIVKR